MVPADQEIESALRSLEGIDVAVVFGSRATGTPRPDSDLDVAVLPSASTDRTWLQARIVASLDHLSPTGRVDVVLFDEAPELLRQRILETGRVVIDRAPERWKEWRIRTMREHDDRAHWRELFRRAQAERLRRGEVGGGRSGGPVGSPERPRKLGR